MYQGAHGRDALQQPGEDDAADGLADYLRRARERESWSVRQAVAAAVPFTREQRYTERPERILEPWLAPLRLGALEID
jgi:hypothetical protein